MADQQVTPAKFGSSSTAQQVARNLSLEKRNVLITGGNSGIGAECVRVFALMGANVYVLCRDTAKGQKLFSTTKNVEIIPLDLGDLKSVKDFLTLWAEKVWIIIPFLQNSHLFSGFTSRYPCQQCRSHGCP